MGRKVRSVHRKKKRKEGRKEGRKRDRDRGREGKGERSRQPVAGIPDQYSHRRRFSGDSLGGPALLSLSLPLLSSSLCLSHFVLPFSASNFQ